MLVTFFRCTILGKCVEPEADMETVHETQRLIKAVDEEWAPVREKIEQEARERPDLAAALREARRNLNRPLDHGRRS